MDELFEQEDTPLHTPVYAAETRQNYFTADFPEPHLPLRRDTGFQANRTAPLTPTGANEFTRTALRGEFAGDESRHNPLSGTGLISKPQQNTTAFAKLFHLTEDGRK